MNQGPAKVNFNERNLFVAIESWMLEEFHLTGNSLILFAYIFIQSIDHTHQSNTSVSTLSKLCSITKQTLVRTVEALPHIIKATSQDHEKGFYVYNYYRIDYQAVLDYLESTGNKSYIEYIKYWKNRSCSYISDEPDIPIDSKDGLKRGIENECTDISTKPTTIPDIKQINVEQTLRDLPELLKGHLPPEVISVLQLSMQFTLGNQVSMTSMETKIDYLCKLAFGDNLPKEMTTENHTDAVNTDTINQNNSLSVPESDDVDTDTKGNDKPIESVEPVESVKSTEPKKRIRPKGARDPRELLGGTASMKKRQKEATKNKSNSLLNKSNGDVNTKPKESKTKLERNIRMKNYTDAALNFVTMYGENNQELLDLLNGYIENVIFVNETGKSTCLSPVQFQCQLNRLKKYKYIEDKLYAVERAFSNGYRSLTNEDDTQIEIRNKTTEAKKRVPELIDEFVQKFNNPERIKTELIRYWEGVCIGRNIHYDQFNGMLSELKDMDEETVYQVVSMSYSHSYTKWYIEKPVTTSHKNRQWNFSIQETPNNDAEDTTLADRERAVVDMWKKYYFYRCPELKDALLNYVRTATVVRNTTYKETCVNISNLFHRRFKEPDMVEAVNVATSNNYRELCRPDYFQEDKIKKAYKTIDKFVEYSTQQRKNICKEYKRLHPEDPECLEMVNLD